MGVTPRFAKVTPPPAPVNLVGGIGSQMPVSTDWQVYSFLFNNSGLQPADIATSLSLPGTRINKLSYRAGDWIVEGVIYAK